MNTNENIVASLLDKLTYHLFLVQAGDRDARAPCFSFFRGGNQGLIKVITHGLDKAADCVPPTTVHESKLSARLDGGKTSSMIVVSKAVQMAIAKVPHEAWNTMRCHKEVYYDSKPVIHVDVL